MNEPIADVKSWSEAYRLSLVPLRRIQQDNLGALDRFARCQYAVAGDFLEWSLALSKVTLVAQSPADLLSKQAELGTKFRETVRSRVQELTKIKSDVQTTSTPAFPVATAVAPVSRVPATAVTAPVPVVPTVAIEPVTTRPQAPSAESSAAHSPTPTRVERPAPASTTPPPEQTAPTVEARTPDLKIVPASVESSPQIANADARQPSNGTSQPRDTAPENGEGTSKSRAPAVSRTARDGGKPKSRGKT